MQGKDLRRETGVRRTDELGHGGKGCDEALNRASEVVGLLAPRHDRIEERPEHPLHGGHDKLLAVAKVYVECAARVAGAGADGIEARRVETALGKLGESGPQERLAGLFLRDLSRPLAL